ncbi:MAG: HDOD domain-containing protein [Pyrinomonadaceae bacterium]|nr:HDOD domain-containing protein [Pyrinomonadaceae bacterium]
MQAFIARQPIFDRNQRVYAYELLFRSSLENVFSNPDVDHASSKTIADSFFLLGFENITQGKKAFVNVTREVLLRDYISLLPKELTVVELLESVEPDAEVIAACRLLKAKGYLLALDDFVYHEGFDPLIALVDIIKVDFLATDLEEQQSLIERLACPGLSFLAEKVETREVFQQALEMGYAYFQGYFFSRPEVVTGRDVPGFKLHYLQILQEIHQPELNFKQLVEIIKRDMSLSYKLLRYINSAYFGRRTQVTSIKQALALLGEKEVKKWATLIVLVSMAQDKPEELVIQAIVRAKLCESLAASAGLAHRVEDLFIMGMFSLIDAILDRELAEILNDLPIAGDIKAALLDGNNSLHNVYQYVLAYEDADWEQLSMHASKLGTDENLLPQLYIDAINWASQSLSTGVLT